MEGNGISYIESQKFFGGWAWKGIAAPQWSGCDGGTAGAEQQRGRLPRSKAGATRSVAKALRSGCLQRCAQPAQWSHRNYGTAARRVSFGRDANGVSTNNLAGDSPPTEGVFTII